LFPSSPSMEKIMFVDKTGHYYHTSRLAMLRRCLRDINETIELCKDSPKIQQMIDKRDEIEKEIDKLFTDAEQYIDSTQTEAGE